jgi:hypothetical protein
VQRYRDLVYAVAFRMAWNAALAEEVAQFVLLALSRNAKALSRRIVLTVGTAAPGNVARRSFAFQPPKEANAWADPLALAVTGPWSNLPAASPFALSAIGEKGSVRVTVEGTIGSRRKLQVTVQLTGD